MSEVEHRAGGEVRLSGSTLAGPVLVYGDVAPGHRERFEAGALAPVPGVPLNLQHDPGLVILEAGAFELTDSPAALELRAELGESSAAVQLVKRGALRGFSIEFRALEADEVDGVRVVRRAELLGVGLVDAPAYPRSRPELRCALPGGNGLPVVWL